MQIHIHVYVHGLYACRNAFPNIIYLHVHVADNQACSHIMGYDYSSVTCVFGS